MSFPPLFEKFGQAAKDLLDCISFDKRVAFRNTSADGVVVQSKLSREAGDVEGPIQGELSIVAPNVFKNGHADVKVDTACAGSASLTTTDFFGYLEKVKGVMTVGSVPFVPGDDADKPAAGGCYYKEQLEVVQDNFTVTAGFETGFQRKYQTVGSASASIGYEGFAAGVGAQFPVYNSANTPVEVDGGLEYHYKDLVAGVLSNNNHKNISIHAHWVSDPRTTVAAVLDHNLVDKDAQSIFTIASSYRVSNNSTFCARANNNGIVGVKLVHKVANPNSCASFAAEFDARSKSLEANKFGFQVQFGDC